MAFALDRLERLNASDPSGRFTGRLDMDRVGVLGHSLGGHRPAILSRRLPLQGRHRYGRLPSAASSLKALRNRSCFPGRLR